VALSGDPAALSGTQGDMWRSVEIEADRERSREAERDRCRRGVHLLAEVTLRTGTLGSTAAGPLALCAHRLRLGRRLRRRTEIDACTGRRCGHGAVVHALLVGRLQLHKGFGARLALGLARARLLRIPIALRREAISMHSVRIREAHRGHTEAHRGTQGTQR